MERGDIRPVAKRPARKDDEDDDRDERPAKRSQRKPTNWAVEDGIGTIVIWGFFCLWAIFQYQSVSSHVSRSETVLQEQAAYLAGTAYTVIGFGFACAVTMMMRAATGIRTAGTKQPDPA